MKEFITTHVDNILFGWKIDNEYKRELSAFLFIPGRPSSETTFYVTNWDEYQKKIEDLRCYANYHQFEIKSMAPITTGYSESQVSSQAWGYGLGLSCVIGYTICMSKKEELSDEEYALRMAKNCERYFKNLLPRWEEELNDLLTRRKTETLGETRLTCPQIETLEIITNKRMFGYVTYDVVYGKGGKPKTILSCDAMEPCEKLLADCKKALEEYDGKINNLRQKIESGQSELEKAALLLAGVSKP